MSKEVVIADFQSQLAELDKIQDTCKKLLQTKHYQQLGEAGIHAIMAKAKALGVHPFEALNGGFHCINGKVGMSTEMMAALVRRRGHSIQKDPKSTNECVILHGKRADNGDTWTCTFSKADAEAAGLWNSATWKKYPETMLYNRCMSKLFRQLFPDLSVGAGYVEDELREIAQNTDAKKKAPEVIDVKPLDIEEQKPEEKISTQQAIHLAAILSECDPQYASKILKYFNIQLIDDLPLEHFDMVEEKAIMSRDKYKLLLTAQETKKQEVA